MDGKLGALSLFLRKKVPYPDLGANGGFAVSCCSAEKNSGIPIFDKGFDNGDRVIA